MSIQDAVTQGAGLIGAGVALYRQSPGYKQKLEDEKLDKEVKKINEEFDKIKDSTIRSAKLRGSSDSELEEELYKLESANMSTLQDLHKSYGKYADAYTFGNLALQFEKRAKESVKTNTTQKKKIYTAVRKRKDAFMADPPSMFVKPHTSNDEMGGPM